MVSPPPRITLSPPADLNRRFDQERAPAAKASTSAAITTIVTVQEPAHEAAKVWYACVHPKYFALDGFFQVWTAAQVPIRLMTTYLLLQETSSAVAVEESHTSSYPGDFVCIGIRYSMPISSTQIAHHSKVPSSPHKSQSHPRQQQRLRRHGERLAPFSCRYHLARIPLGGCLLSLFSYTLVVNYVSSPVQIPSSSEGHLRETARYVRELFIFL